MNAVTIPQLNLKPYQGFLIIFVGLPLLYYGHQFSAGEIHTWTDISWDSIQHRTFTSFWTAVFWIFARSPWASQITQLTSEATSTSASGDKISQTHVVTIEQSPAPPQDSNLSSPTIPKV